MDNTVVISTPPHVKSKRTTKGIMLDVIIALMPAAIAGIVFFGWQALVIELVSVASAVATEFVYYFIYNGGFKAKCANAGAVCKKWLKQFDYTSIITGLILALVLPSTTKWYEVMIGAIFAIAVVKMLFGGTGKNLVSPSSAGRVMMFLSFSITTYTAANIGAIGSSSSIFTGATYLSGYLLGGNSGANMSLLDMFLGTGVAGCIGETCKLAILVGYIYLVVRQVIKWWQPLLYVVLSAFLSVCLAATVEGASFDVALFPAYALSGGLMFGAVFMATDYVTSPKGVLGQIVYLIALAVLTSLLRFFTKIEVVSFAILIMNLVVPLIDTYIVRKPFGYKKEKKVKEGK
ncbi:MAG: RnfABCDGE type electron transport complex subunit D [Candidatus Coproplasma sp.]